MQHTLLHDWHILQGANMADFGGYHMPLWYPAGAKAEHLAVITTAGLFDTSHMAVIHINGPGAFDLLQTTFSRDLDACGPDGGSPLPIGHSLYGVFLKADGHLVDDAVVARMARDDFTVTVNANMGPKVAGLLSQHALPGVRVADLSGEICKFDLQGPLAAKILGRILENPDQTFDALPYFSQKGGFTPNIYCREPVRLDDQTPILLSRSGYTGEFGFEIYVHHQAGLGTWEKLLKAGSAYGLQACGLAARDSLRVGANLPLARQDIGDWPFIRNPWEFALPFTADGQGFTKSFPGSDALLAAQDAPYTYAFAGFDPRKVSSASAQVFREDQTEPFGRILTCTTDMAIGRAGDRIVSLASANKPADFNPRGLCCGFVRVDGPLSPGTILQLKEAKRALRVEIVLDIRPERSARLPMRLMR